MLGYQLRNTPNIISDGGWTMYQPPKRKSYNDCYAEWQRNMRALSGATDLTLQGVDAQVQEAFASDPKYADSYAAAECAEGLHRELHPNDPTET
jgi:hypothetical protein